MRVENDVEMSASENQIVVYQPNETVRLDVRFENETVWLTQLKIAELFGVQKAAIIKHVKNIFASGELIKDATVSRMETVHAEGGRQPPYLLCRPNGCRNHLWTSRLNPQGYDRAPRRHRAAEIARIKK